MKKTLVLTLVITLLCSSTFAQYWLTLMPVSKKENPDYNEISKAFYDYWKDHKFEKGNAFKQFKRMEYYLNPRLDKNGEFPGGAYYREIEKMQETRDSRDDAWGNWSCLGPDYTPFWMNQTRLSGSGRLDCIEFHPQDTNTIWVGAPYGRILEID